MDMAQAVRNIMSLENIVKMAVLIVSLTYSYTRLESKVDYSIKSIESLISHQKEDEESLKLMAERTRLMSVQISELEVRMELLEMNYEEVHGKK